MPVKAVTRKRCSIPARPEVLVAVGQLMKSEDPDIEQICFHLKQDVALYVSVLGTVNTAYFGLPQQITQLERAAGLLGLNRLYAIVRLAAMRSTLSGLGRLERFWDTATEVAHICSLLAQRYPSIDRDEAYTLGMMHECGIPVMMQNFDDYKTFLPTLNDISLPQMHKQQWDRYGQSHFTVGAQMAKEWCLPDTTVQAIKNQPGYKVWLSQSPADGQDEGRMLLAILLLSKVISDSYRRYWRINSADIQQFELNPVLEFCGLCDYDFLDIKEDIIQQLQS
ncbi:HDOD domain-containing protein [Marinobacterium jannaschii]|uniref:HDOD domain-containing protein n=1 Tax=Marinobacterium jannaschii TaxID=64970 RepID=UPI0004843811|nr:HDOD domain-containing protein [Marinobacterium jannaschii]